MTIYLEMAQRLEREIEAEEAHLANLRSALAALQPLITVDVNAGPKATINLGYKPARVDLSATPFVEEVQAEPEVAALGAEAHPEPDAPAQRGRPRGSRNSKPVMPAVAEEAPVSNLPATGAGFWIKVMGKRAHTINDIVTKAVSNLELDDNVRPVLANRLSAWLYPSLKSGRVVQAGLAGKLKRYKVAAQ